MSPRAQSPSEPTGLQWRRVRRLRRARRRAPPAPVPSPRSASQPHAAPAATVLEEIPLGLVSVLGIAPAGYATITVPNTDGTSRTVAVDDNGLYDFAIKPGDSFMTLDGPSMPPVRVRVP
jgi:hypothetical protein